MQIGWELYFQVVGTPKHYMWSSKFLSSQVVTPSPPTLLPAHSPWSQLAPSLLPSLPACFPWPNLLPFLPSCSPYPSTLPACSPCSQLTPSLLPLPQLAPITPLTPACSLHFQLTPLGPAHSPCSQLSPPCPHRGGGDPNT